MTTPTLLQPGLADTLRPWLAGRMCVVGVGNRLRGDDGAGPAVIDARPADARGTWLDAGVAPENFLEPILRLAPDVILFVDAVDFGGRPGELRLLDPAEVDAVSLSTHTGSLGLLRRYLAGRTPAPIRILALQPHTLAPGRTLSPPVRDAVHTAAQCLGAADHTPSGGDGLSDRREWVEEVGSPADNHSLRTRDAGLGSGDPSSCCRAEGGSVSNELTPGDGGGNRN